MIYKWPYLKQVKIDLRAKFSAWLCDRIYCKTHINIKLDGVSEQKSVQIMGMSLRRRADEHYHFQSASSWRQNPDSCVRCTINYLWTYHFTVYSLYFLSFTNYLFITFSYPTFLKNLPVQKMLQKQLHIYPLSFMYFYFHIFIFVYFVQQPVTVQSQGYYSNRSLLAWLDSLD